MKRIMKKSFLIFSFLIFVSFMAFSQENAKISPYIHFSISRIMMRTVI